MKDAECYGARSPLSRRVDTRVLGALPTNQREHFIEALSLIVERLEASSDNSRA